MKCFAMKILIANVNVNEYEVRDMDTIFIDDEPYVIMKRSEYADVSQAFIDEGKSIERMSRMRDDAAVLGVLSFYASEGNYIPDMSEVAGVEPGNGLMQCDLSRVFSDNGKRARDVIADMDGARSRNVSGKVPRQCVISDETVVVMAHSDDDYRLVLDIMFGGVCDPAKLVLIVDSACSLRDVLQEFIHYAKLGGRDG